MNSSSQRTAGIISGTILLPTIFYPQISLLLILLLIASCIKKYNKRRASITTPLLIFSIITIFKKLAINNLDYNLLITNFSIIVLAIAISRKINSDFIKGLGHSVRLIFYIDLFFNIWSLIHGQDLFGRHASIRDDGNRYGGLAGHSFYSISISLVYFINIFIERRNKKLLIFSILNIYFAGALRGVGHVIYLLIFLLMLYRLSWKKQIVATTLAAISIAIITIFSVSLGYLSSSSGNAYRIIAWQNSVAEIQNNILFGTTKIFKNWDQENGVSEDSLIETGTTESAFLGDLLNYGIIAVILKLSALFLLVKNLNQYKVSKHDLNDRIYLYLSNFMIIDYFIFSIWGGVYVSYIISCYTSFAFNEMEKQHDKLK